MNGGKSEDPPVNGALLRENLIETAVRFLTNHNVSNRPLEQKIGFLKQKGMTDTEIKVAIDRASTSTPIVQQPLVPLYPPVQVLPSKPSIWTQIRDIVHTLALLGGVGYAIFWLYKTYVEPFLFGRRKPKPKSTKDSLSELEKNVAEISKATADLRTEFRAELTKLNTERESCQTLRKLSELKTDISTVKGILLSRQQFPGAPVSTNLRSSTSNKPSIPAWQMKKSENSDVEDDHEAESVKAVEENVDGNNSPSGSNEPPPTNGSDSSLEMIQE